MEFSSINIQGNIVSSEILDKIRNEDIKYQNGADFGLDRKTTVRDEIGIAWAAARAHYTAFKMRVERLKEGDSGASETRNSWILPLLRELGYDVEKAPAFIHPDTQKSYAISHRGANLGDFPIHIMGIKDDLDKRRENSGPRLSPHALTQEFLNNTEHTYALVTNGQFLRLLRDATRLVRLSYLEFDLVKMMEDDLYADFAILFRLLHATRMPKKADQTEESYIEYYHLDSLASGSRIREKLSEAVEKSIKELANGFLSHPENESVRAEASSAELKPEKFYLHQLRLIYRFLFLIVTEERNLVYPDSREENVQRKRKIYYDYYSIERLRKLAAKLHYVDGRKNDLWEGLKATFHIYEKGFYGEKIGIRPLGSGLFSEDALGDLPYLKLDNETLLRVIRHLTLFENDQHQFVRVNYSDLDVEEFGSVYEGLLEFDAAFKDINGSPRFTFVEGTGRSSSGSHYTPEELVKPLIKHSLEYIIEDKLKEKEPEKALLSIKVCDVACGSGHILLSAARRIASELARVRTNEDQPTPTAIRLATRDVIKNCIYGVDKNPLAVELCKVALWLEAHNPGEPLNFLDHHIKCGDAIVGLAHREELENGIADAAFKTLPGDEKEIATAFAKQNKQERKAMSSKGAALQLTTKEEVEKTVEVNLQEYRNFDRLPETTPEEIAEKQNAYNRFLQGKGSSFLKLMADTQVAQFFIPKTTANNDRLVTDNEYRQILAGQKGWQNMKTAKATAVAADKRFFHWFLEFPEVFQNGGFDCILGNPPFLGNRKLTGTFSDNMLESIKHQFQPIGAVDLVTYFFRRVYSIINQDGFISLISTKTIAQGNARVDGLAYILNSGGTINHAVKSMPWPGRATVDVVLITITKRLWSSKYILSGKTANRITSYLDDAESNDSPYTLSRNSGICFQGSIVLGKGFVLESNAAEELKRQDEKNNDVIFQYLTGDDLNSRIDHSPSRYVINFFDWSEEKARKYPQCFEILETLVKPERQKWEVDRDGNVNVGTYALRKPLPTKWWIYADKRPALYSAIKELNRVIVVAKTTKYGVYCFQPNNIVYTQDLTVFPYDDFGHFVVLNSTIMNEWCWKNSATMGSSTIRLNPSACFETFPFLNLKTFHTELDDLGKRYEARRSELTTMLQIGFTSLFNLFHEKELTPMSVLVATEGKLGQTKYIDYLVQAKAVVDTVKPEFVIQSEVGIGLIEHLRNLQIEIDQTVLEIYSWSDIQLRHDFYEVDYLPENDRVRFTIHPEARKEILKRLLELNHKYYEEEIKQGLHKKEDVEKFYKEKGVAVPEEVVVLMEKGKAAKSSRSKKQTTETGSDLFSSAE